MTEKIDAEYEVRGSVCIDVVERTAVENMRWRQARFFFEHLGDPEFEAMCKTLRVSVREAKRLALEFAHG